MYFISLFFFKIKREEQFEVEEPAQRIDEEELPIEEKKLEGEGNSIKIFSECEKEDELTNLNEENEPLAVIEELNVPPFVQQEPKHEELPIINKVNNDSSLNVEKSIEPTVINVSEMRKSISKQKLNQLLKGKKCSEKELLTLTMEDLKILHENLSEKVYDLKFDVNNGILTKREICNNINLLFQIDFPK